MDEPVYDDLQTSLVEGVLHASAWHMDTLRAVRDLGLSDWAIGAGFVRNAVWDHLHGFHRHTPLADVDVLYFDPSNPDKAAETCIRARLDELLPDRPWSVKNQARMHLRNGDPAYRSTEEAMSYWLETPTCVAVRLEPEDELTVIAPFGLGDLIAMRARPTPRGRIRGTAYLSRMQDKNWSATWPRVVVQEKGLQPGS